MLQTRELRFSYCCLLTSAKIGTVELTGLEMTRNIAVGQCLAHASAMP